MIGAPVSVIAWFALCTDAYLVDVTEPGAGDDVPIRPVTWENANFEVLDIEQNEAFGFYCADLEVELRTY